MGKVYTYCQTLPWTLYEPGPVPVSATSPPTSWAYLYVSKYPTDLDNNPAPMSRRKIVDPTKKKDRSGANSKLKY